MCASLPKDQGPAVVLVACGHHLAENIAQRVSLLDGEEGVDLGKSKGVLDRLLEHLVVAKGLKELLGLNVIMLLVGPGDQVHNIPHVLKVEERRRKKKEEKRKKEKGKRKREK